MCGFDATCASTNACGAQHPIEFRFNLLHAVLLGGGHGHRLLSLSVLGCVVNGPGEARETDIGLTGGGNGKHMVYLSGVTDHTIQDADMVDHIVRLVEAKAAEIEAAASDAGQVQAAE